MKLDQLFEDKKASSPLIDKMIAAKKKEREAQAFDPHEYHDMSKFADVSSAEHVAAIIDANCAEMVQAYQETNRVLYRGLDTKLPAVMTRIRQDRKPVELAGDKHEFLHELFLKAGLKATRKNSIFCSANRSIAFCWGSRIYIIFIKDGWTGTVFDGVKTGYSFSAMSYIGRMGEGQAMKELKALKPRSFDNANDLMTILNDKYEDVIITGDSYIGLQVENPVTRDVLKILGIKVKA